MKIVVFGASGGTGRQVVAQAVALGHEVTAVVRRVAAMEGSERLRLVVAGLDEHSALDGALRGQDAVISALGAHENGPVRVCADGSAAIVAAMHRAGVTRLVAMSAYGTRETRHRSLYSWAVWAKVPHTRCATWRPWR